MISSGETNSVFIKTDENTSFLNSIPCRWRFPNYLEDGIFDKLKKFLEVRSQNNIELHVVKVRRRGNQTKLHMRNIKYQILILLKKMKN